jgi:hypothetical protein
VSLQKSSQIQQGSLIRAIASAKPGLNQTYKGVKTMVRQPSKKNALQPKNSAQVIAKTCKKRKNVQDSLLISYHY